MTIDDELEALRMQLDKLEDGPCVVGDWHRLEARAMRTLIVGQRIGAAHRVLQELAIIRMCAQSRIFEHDAKGKQSGFSNWQQ